LVNWRWGLLIVILLQAGLAVLRGRVELGYWGGLLSEMLPTFTVLVFLEFLTKMRGRYLIPVLVFQVGLGALTGARSGIVFALALLLAVLTRYQVRINWKSLLPLGVAGVVFIFAISVMRVEVGRFTFATQTNEERIRSILIGVEGVVTNGIQPAVLEDFVYRFDGNAFPGLIEAAYQERYPAAGRTPILNNLSLAVPSFLNPNKLEADRLMLNEEDYLVDHYGMPAYRINQASGEITGDLIDYISTTWGILFGAFGSWGLLFSGFVMGGVYAVLDNWLLRSRSLLAVIGGIGLTSMAIGLEAGTRIYFLTLRSILVLFLILAIFGALRRVAVFRPARRQPVLKLPGYSELPGPD